jgi:His/Glu/Gln/Arg/opine family amino acid ABC transporter permease subunit
MDFNFIARSLPALSGGILLTIQLAALAIVGAALGGLVVLAARRSSHPVIRGLAVSYIEVMRNTPVMVQVFVFYFGLPSLGLYPSAFASAVIALVLQSSAYVGEIYRAGVESVGRTQTEAALALGMLPGEALRRIVLPQAFRRALPALGNQSVWILKDTSIASTIAVAELTQAGKLLLDRSAAPYEIFLTIGVFYLLMSAVVLGLLKVLAVLFPVRT